MAIDTKEKRRSALDFGKFCGTGMPIPTGNIQEPQRAHILNLYSGIAVVSIVTVFWRNRNLVGSAWLDKALVSASWQMRALPAGSWAVKASPSSAWQKKSNPSSGWVGRTPPPDGPVQEI